MKTEYDLGDVVDGPVHRHTVRKKEEAILFNLGASAKDFDIPVKPNQIIVYTVYSLEKVE